MPRRRNNLASLLGYGSSSIGSGTIPTITLDDAGFTPAAFTYKPIELSAPDYNILARSLALNEQRQQDTQKKFEEVNKALGAAKTALYDSPDNQEFVNRRENELFAPVNSALERGDFASALKEASAAGAKFANDNEFIARLKTSEDYKKEIEALQSRVGRDINQNTYDWWVHNNPYKFVPQKDESGNIIGGQKYNPQNRPVKDINVEDLFKQAFDLYTEERGSTSSKVTNADGSGSGGGRAFHRKDPKRILELAQTILSSNSEYTQAIHQRFNADAYHLETLKRDLDNTTDPVVKSNLKQQYDQLKEMLYDNDQKNPDYDKYFKRLILNSPYAQSLGYNWTDVDSMEDNSTSASRNAGLGGGGGYDNQPKPDKTLNRETVNGPQGSVKSYVGKGSTRARHF